MKRRIGAVRSGRVRSVRAIRPCLKARVSSFVRYWLGQELLDWIMGAFMFFAIGMIFALLIAYGP